MSPPLAWTLIAVLGVAMAMWGAFDAWGDWRVWRHRPNGITERRYALSYVRDEVITLVMQGSFALIGILTLADLLPPGIGAWVLVAGLALLLVKSVLGALDRVRTRRELEQAAFERAGADQ